MHFFWCFWSSRLKWHLETFFLKVKIFLKFGLLIFLKVLLLQNNRNIQVEEFFFLLSQWIVNLLIILWVNIIEEKHSCQGHVSRWLTLGVRNVPCFCCQANLIFKLIFYWKQHKYSLNHILTWRTINYIISPIAIYVIFQMGKAWS